jgi:uncharacterized membrane protein
LIVLGVGLGAFVDGIVLHQMLQWHHMLTGTGHHPMDSVAGIEDNTVADGLFHLFAWVLVVVGATLLVRAWQRGSDPPSWMAYVGLLIVGWGAFNVVEGVVDHHLLELHHVRDDVSDPSPWDLAFLASGLVLIVVGWLLARHGHRRLPAGDRG